MLFTLLFLILTYFILAHSDISLYYAFYGFSLWYSKMIPSLLPFMIISGILVRMNLTEYFSNILHPVLKRIFRCSHNVSYAIIIGFLCGFPMGAKVTADLLKANKITENEAEFLLCFCNNIGPVYFCSFVIPLLKLQNSLPYLLGMYGIPFLYGVILRYTAYKGISVHSSKKCPNQENTSILAAVDESIKASIQSILMLCGYMILFNLLNIIPHFLMPTVHNYIAPLLEITGGLSMLGGSLHYYSLCLLTFGGLSCIAQTHSMIHGTKLQIKKYIVHKSILVGITVMYYLLFHHLF